MLRGRNMRMQVIAHASSSAGSLDGVTQKIAGGLQHTHQAVFQTGHTPVQIVAVLGRAFELGVVIGVSPDHQLNGAEPPRVPVVEPSVHLTTIMRSPNYATLIAQRVQAVEPITFGRSLEREMLAQPAMAGQAER